MPRNKTGEQLYIGCPACKHDKFYVWQNSLTGIVEVYCSNCDTTLISATVQLPDPAPKRQVQPI